jgi:hypothetical protein
MVGKKSQDNNRGFQLLKKIDTFHTFFFRIVAVVKMKIQWTFLSFLLFLKREEVSKSVK